MIFRTLRPSLAMLASGLVLTVTLAGCSTGNTEDNGILNPAVLTENELYNRSQLRMRSGNFIGAIDLFKILLQRYPFGRYAEQAQIELVYAHFMSYQVEEAQTEADRFLRLYPQHQNADYARFIRAYSIFHRDASISARTFRLNYARRDVSLIRQSFEALAEFLKLHGESPYSSLARRRMLQLKEMLAYHELWVAEFYLRRGAFLAVVNRASWVLKHIPDTSATPWALAMMSRGYDKMDLGDEAADALLILKANFSDHEVLNQTGELVETIRLPNEERTIASILTLGLFDSAVDGESEDQRFPPPPESAPNPVTEVTNPVELDLPQSAP